MNKDIIYIDTEDDITAIIGKIKSSKDKIVALVPPKRTGVLQSAVNLRLLARMAENGGKRLVIVTNNKALIALTAAAKIPVAKTLQSKPEIAEIDALEIDDGEDIIEGSQLPIGELAKTVKSNNDDEIVEDMGTIDIDNDTPQSIKSPTEGSVAFKSSKSGQSSSKSGIKVPDISKFRKKLLIGVIAGLLLIVFLVWAILIAPSAKIIITAKAEQAPVSITLNLSGTIATNINKNTVQTVTKTLEKDISVDFTATGTQTLGTKATGKLTLSNSDDSDPISVPTGTVFSNGNLNFVTTASVTVPGATVHSGIVPGTITVSVEAADVGSDYNLSASDYSSSIDGVTASGTAMTGGASHEATVVTVDDIQKASQALADLSTSSVKSQLTKEFTNGEKIISDSFTADYTAAVSTPAVGAEVASGSKAKLTSSTNFSLIAIAKSEVETYLKSELNKQINSKSQRIYDDGINKVTLSGYDKNGTTATVNLAATGYVGPTIDTDSIKQQVKGKRFGDAQSLINGIEGVSNVDIKFSYFWVNTVPSDINKIDVQFTIKNA